MPSVEKLSITLPYELARMVKEKVDSGTYSSNSEVIREGLRLLQDQEAIKLEKLAALRETINRSLDDGGPSLDAEDVFNRLEERHRERMKESNT